MLIIIIFPTATMSTDDTSAATEPIATGQTPWTADALVSASTVTATEPKEGTVAEDTKPAVKTEPATKKVSECMVYPCTFVSNCNLYRI